MSGNMTNATNMQMTAGKIPYPQGTILLNGNVTGNYTISGEGGGERNVTGFVLITKNLNNKTERVEIWDKNDKTIVLRAKGPLTPVNVKPSTSQNQMMAIEAGGTFALADVKDFKCNMTNLKQEENDQNVNINLTGPEMKVFGGWNDVVNIFLKPNANASECNLTQITYFRIPL
jgi:hypothetical protein